MSVWRVIPRIVGAVVLLVGAWWVLEQTQVIRHGRSEAAHDRTGNVVRWAIRTAPEIVIGVALGAPEYELERVRDVARLRDGRIVVANGAAELRFYSPSGNFLSQQGRTGAGPGEYREIQAMSVSPGDTILVYDEWQRRLSVISPDGKFVRSIQTEPGAVLPLRGVFADGSMLVGPIVREWLPTSAVTESSIEEYVHLGTDGRPVRRVAQRRGPERFVVTFPNGGRGQRRLPFAALPNVAVANDRFFVSEAASGEIESYAMDGRPLGHFQLPHVPPAVTAHDLALWLEEQLDAPGTLEGARRELERLFGEMPKPAHYPAVGQLLVDELGRVWAQAYPRIADSTSTWYVFDQDGSQIASVALPADIKVHRIGGDYVLGVRRGAMDEHQVVLYRLLTSTTAAL